MPITHVYTHTHACTHTCTHKHTHTHIYTPTGVILRSQAHFAGTYSSLKTLCRIVVQNVSSTQSSTQSSTHLNEGIYEDIAICTYVVTIIHIAIFFITYCIIYDK